MNILAYLVFHSPTLSGPFALIVNLLFYCLFALVVFLILRKFGAKMGVDADIINLVGLILFLAAVTALFTGCSSYQASVQSRTLSAGYSKDSGVGFSDAVTYR